MGDVQQDFAQAYRDMAKPLPAVRHGCGYMRKAFDDQHKLISDARRILADKVFDTFVATGVSGMVAAPLLAYALNKRFLIVRKPEDKANHSGYRAEGLIVDRWVFVDDLIASGTTLENVQDAVGKLDSGPYTYVGAYTYGDSFTEAQWRLR